MNYETTQIVQSAQVWVCESCGTQDHKSCSCNSSARMELLAAKREAQRQANRRSREKSKENQQSRHDIASVENIDEFPPDDDGSNEPYDDDETIWRRGLLYRARSATAGAAFEKWKFKVDPQLVSEARAAADAWNKLASYLQELSNGKQAAA